MEVEVQNNSDDREEKQEINENNSNQENEKNTDEEKEGEQEHSIQKEILDNGREEKNEVDSSKTKLSGMTEESNIAGGKRRYCYDKEEVVISKILDTENEVIILIDQRIFH